MRVEAEIPKDADGERDAQTRDDVLHVQPLRQQVLSERVQGEARRGDERIAPRLGICAIGRCAEGPMAAEHEIGRRAARCADDGGPRGGKPRELVHRDHGAEVGGGRDRRRSLMPGEDGPMGLPRLRRRVHLIRRRRATEAPSRGSRHAPRLRPA